jgi:hypothetical protein
MLPFYGSDHEPALFVGWDTEYSQVPPAVDDGRKAAGSNHVLSYQFFVLGGRSHWSGIHFTSEGIHFVEFIIDETLHTSPKKKSEQERNA